MKVALLALGLLGHTGCVRASEGIVREQAAAAFSCADYALDVEEVGPDVYRASGCGQELIYSCRAVAPRDAHGAHHARVSEPEDADEVADAAEEPALVCIRRPR